MLHSAWTRPPMCSRLVLKHRQGIWLHLVGTSGSHALPAGQLLLAKVPCIPELLPHAACLPLLSAYSLGPLPSILMPPLTSFTKCLWKFLVHNPA